MSIFDDILAKESAWESEYDEYLEKEKKLDLEAQSIYEEIRSYVEGINTIKQKLIGPMNLMYSFLSGIGQVDTLPAYKDVQFEHVPGYVPEPVVATKNTQKYTNLRSEYDTTGKRIGKYFAHRIKGTDEFSTRIMKSYYIEITSKKGNELLETEEDLKSREAVILKLQLELEISKLYHQIFAVVEETVEQVILKEIPFIKAFLYANGVLDCVKSGNIPSNATPARIKNFKFSTKYKRHYNFVKNTHDFYTLLINYYQNGYLTRLLAEKDTAKSTVSADLNNAQNKSQILKADSLMWRNTNGK